MGCLKLTYNHYAKTPFAGVWTNPESKSISGVGWYDFGARNYDPALGMWFNVDPMAELEISNTPYNYCANNPVNYIDPNGMWKQHIDPWGGGFGDGGNGGGGTGGSGGIFGNGRRKCKYPDNTGNWLDKLKSEWNYDGVGYDPSYEPSYNNSRGTTGLNGSGGTGESTESVGGVSAGGGGNSVAIPETPQQDPNISLPNPKENDGMNPNGGLPSPIDLGMDDEDIISAILYHFAYYKKNNPHPYHLSDVIVPNSEHSVGNKTADDFKKFWGSFQGHFDGEADFNGVRITWWIGFGYNYESDYLNGIGQKTMDMGSNRQDGYKIFLYNQNNSDPRVMIVIYDWEYYKYINKLIGYE